MKYETCEVPPEMGGVLRAIAATTSMNLVAAVREWFDNSLDASAKSVVISYLRDKARITIQDDGEGAKNPRAVVTLFLHESHPTTQSGTYGIGGKMAQLWCTGGTGKVRVHTTRPDGTYSDISVDFEEIGRTGRFEAKLGTTIQAGRDQGTTIVIEGCREIKGQSIGNARKELSRTFTPALRRGVCLAFESDGNREEWKPIERPKHEARQKFAFEVYGHKVTGFCDLVAAGAKNPLMGWAVEFGHRFIDVFEAPAGDSSVSLIYGEIKLPSSWRDEKTFGINNLKNGFTQDPTELWEAVGAACADIISRAQKKGESIDIDACSAVAQNILDQAIGFSGPPIKERRPGPHKEEGAVEPADTGPPRENFKVVQPGDKPSNGRPASLPSRILIEWVPGCQNGNPYEIRAKRNRVRFLLDETDPSNAIYRGKDSGPFLADFVLGQVAADSILRATDYLPLFANSEAQEIPSRFAEMRAGLKKRQAEQFQNSEVA